MVSSGCEDTQLGVTSAERRADMARWRVFLEAVRTMTEEKVVGSWGEMNNA